MLKKSHLLLLILLLGCTIPQAFAEDTISRPRAYEAITDLIDQFGDKLEKVKDQTSSFTVTQFSQSENYPGQMRDYVLHRLELVVKSRSEGKVRYIRCTSCLNPRAISDGKDVYIRKGFVDNDELKETMKRLDARSYMMINLGNSDDEAILQISIYNSENHQLIYSDEFKTALQGPDRTGVIFGLGLESIMFHDSKYPSLNAGRLSVAQRLVGLGDVGVSVLSSGKRKGFPAMMSFGGMFDFNHNEMFNKRGRYLSVIYPVEFGVTDFNGDVQVRLSAGIKLRIGSTLYVSLKEAVHAFITKPKNSGTLPLQTEGDNQNKDKAEYKSDKPIPPALLLGFGADF